MATVSITPSKPRRNTTWPSKQAAFTAPHVLLRVVGRCYAGAPRERTMWDWSLFAKPDNDLQPRGVDASGRDRPRSCRPSRRMRT